MQKYDAIIIGSGLGGLSCGATLAKAGKKVLVLEQHSLIGGCATCFKRKGTNVDAGLHELDYGDPKTDMKPFVFEKLGIKDKIEILPLPTAWSVSVLSEDEKEVQSFVIPHNQDKVKQALKDYFPNQSTNIDTYFKAINLEAYAVRRFPWDLSFLDFFFFPITTAWIYLKNQIQNTKVAQKMDQMFQDNHLKHLLNANIAYYHHDPKKFIWSFHAIPQKHYYDQGVYVKGGGQSISNALQSVIEENGGEVRARCDVIKILTQDTNANGVIYLDKKDKQEHQVFADKIIANCDPRIVYEDLLKDSSIDTSLDTQHIQDKPDSVSLVSAYLIFDKNISTLYPQMDYSTFIFKQKVFDTPFSSSDHLQFALQDRPMAFVNYSKIPSGLSPTNDHFLGVVALASTLQEWEELSPEEYKAKKDQLLKQIIQTLDSKFPNLSQHLTHAELATPKTIKRYIHTKSGTPYGFAQDKEGMGYRLGWKSKSVKNLYFASAFCFPGGGFTGAILGGYRTANLILNPYSFFKRLALCVAFGVSVSLLIQFTLKALF